MHGIQAKKKPLMEENTFNANIRIIHDSAYVVGCLSFVFDYVF